MSELHQAYPLNVIVAEDASISFTYGLVGGDYDSKVVLVSSIIKRGVEETAVFLCEDVFANTVDWNAIARVRVVDTELALNQLGYTTRVNKT